MPLCDLNEFVEEVRRGFMGRKGDSSSRLSGTSRPSRISRAALTKIPNESNFSVPALSSWDPPCFGDISLRAAFPLEPTGFLVQLLQRFCKTFDFICTSKLYW